MCVTHEVQEVLIIQIRVWLRSFFIINQFKSSFLMRFLACFDLKHLPLEELLCCMGVVEYHRNDSKIGLLMI